MQFITHILSYMVLLIILLISKLIKYFFTFHCIFFFDFSLLLSRCWIIINMNFIWFLLKVMLAFKIMILVENFFKSFWHIFFNIDIFIFLLQMGIIFKCGSINNGFNITLWSNKLRTFFLDWFLAGRLVIHLAYLFLQINTVIVRALR